MYYPDAPNDLKEAVVQFFQNGQIAPSTYPECPTQYYNLLLTIECPDDAPPNPEASTTYYYYIDCCQYVCSPAGGYAATFDGEIDTTITPGAAGSEQFEGDFDLVDGRAPCYQGLYPAPEYTGALNPDFDYNPNVSGNQPQDD